MAMPEPEPRLPFEAAPRINPLELNTIAPPSRRPPYVFKTDSQPLPPRGKPYVFPEMPADADAARSIHLFEFLAKTTKRSEPAPPDPWSTWSDALASQDDPEEVSAMLATLLSDLEGLAEARLRRQNRMLPVWAPMVPPLCILLAQGLGLWALSPLAEAPGFQLLPSAGPIVAGVLAVPMGLWATSLVLGRWLGRTAPGMEVRLGDRIGTVLSVTRFGWVLDLKGLGKRQVPFYQTAFAAPERLPARMPHV